MRRAAAVVLLLLGFLLVTPAGSASAAPCLPGEPTWTGCTPLDIGGGITDKLQDVVDKICPPRKAPGIEAPGDTSLALLDPKVPEEKQGLFARYRYAGLSWTTFDQSCASMAGIDTSVGNGINMAAITGDEMINEVQTYATDPRATATVDRALPKAITALKTSFWDKYMLSGTMVAGLVILGVGLLGRSNAMTMVALNLVVVLSAVTWLFAHPKAIPDVSNYLTSTVAAEASQGLSGALLDSDVPDKQAISEAYYRIAYQSWVTRWSCGDKDAERRYATRLIRDTAWSVTELRRYEGSPAAAAKAVAAKKADWLKVGEEMKRTNPVAFDCWSGAAGTAFGAGVKHALVTVFAGVWIVLAAGAIIVLKNMLIFGLLLAVAFGVILLFSRRVTGKHVEFLVMASIGPPVVALISATVITFYAAILADPQQAWNRSIIACIAFGVASFFSIKQLRHMAVGFTAFEAVQRRGHRTVHGRTSKLHRGTSSTAVGAAAGAAHHGSDADTPRAHHGSDADTPRAHHGSDADTPRAHHGSDADWTRDEDFAEMMPHDVYDETAVSIDRPEMLPHDVYDETEPPNDFTQMSRSLMRDQAERAARLRAEPGWEAPPGYEGGYSLMDR